MKVAIVGSRSASDYEAWKKLALGVLPENISMIVSGGAKGIDAFAAPWLGSWDFRSWSLSPITGSMDEVLRSYGIRRL